MENLILNLMPQANVSEEELRDKSDVSEEKLRDKGKLGTECGEKLSWKYLCYAREHPICWTAPTHILYGKKDHPSSFETICELANRAQATLMVMKNGEHRFCAAEQMRFLDGWIRRFIRLGALRKFKFKSSRLRRVLLAPSRSALNPQDQI